MKYKSLNLVLLVCLGFINFGWSDFSNAASDRLNSEVQLAKAYAGVLKVQNQMQVNVGIYSLIDIEKLDGFTAQKPDYSEFMASMNAVADLARARDEYYSVKGGDLPWKSLRYLSASGVSAAGVAFGNVSHDAAISAVSLGAFIGLGSLAAMEQLAYQRISQLRSKFYQEHQLEGTYQGHLSDKLLTQKFWDTLKAEGISFPEKKQDREQWLLYNHYSFTNVMYSSLGYLVKDLVSEMKNVSDEMLHAVITAQFGRVSLDPGIQGIHEAIQDEMLDIQRESGEISLEYDPKFRDMYDAFRTLEFNHKDLYLNGTIEQKAQWVAKAYSELFKLASRYEVYFANGASNSGLPVFLARAKDLSAMKNVCDLALKSRPTI